MAKTRKTTEPFRSEDWPGSRKPEMWKLDRIKEYSRNPMRHPPEQVEALARDMKADGVLWPVLVDEHGVLLAGHGRKLAARAAGFEEYPVVQVFGLAEGRKQEIRIKDNQRARQGEWIEDLLKGELLDLRAQQIDVSMLGFDAAQIARLLDSTPGQVDPEQVPTIPANPYVRIGDTWKLGRHTLVCGDSTDQAAVDRALAGATPKLMVTDPPYGVEYDPDWRNRVIRSNGTRVAARAIGQVSNDDRADWRVAWALFPGDAAYVWHGGLHSGEVQASLEAAGFVMRAQVIWDKTRLVIGRGDYHWQHEPCWYAVRKGKTGHWNGGRSQTTVWPISHQKSETGHSTQKPIECMKRPIENNSKAGDHVYEPFCGSGTTIIACEMTGRVGHAIELNPAYVQVTVERWAAFTGQEPTLEGKTRQEVRKSRRILNAPRNSGKPTAPKRRAAKPAVESGAGAK